MMSARRRRDFQSRYGPWAVVTGGSSGIGRAMALQLGAAGLNLVIVGRRQELLSDLVAELGGFCESQTRVVVANLATPIGIETVEDACQAST